MKLISLKSGKQALFKKNKFKDIVKGPLGSFFY